MGGLSYEILLFVFLVSVVLSHGRKIYAMASWLGMEFRLKQMWSGDAALIGRYVNKQEKYTSFQW
jgi:hypothetical protein